MTKERFIKAARDGFKIKATDEELDKMWEETEREIAEYKEAHPREWEAAEERAREQEGL